ncbi:carbon-nitrogen family hydrolase [Pontibacillus yanchengensis]|uniref:Carbon-nitrogen family hydrolase n=2 Tax=Pontibacillus yanchengensis TaxID=462910 RepID=A0ACC7VID5_9BACI|nr:carbon-nitrogen family hydrolase [Pontibacillus yanchengensis]MYL33868.1 carbon-nitrogen family hydrolase [Pontibacillus yanchengensis]MYL53894.1 carbon-nitrogen family hydrolase [Pontibacillus yanchengensis]
MNVAIYQMDVIPGDVRANHKRVEEWMEKTVPNSDYEIVVLPEMWTTAYTLPELQEIADVDGEPTTSFLQKMAKQYGVHVVGGSFANKIEGEVYNTAIVVNKQGEVVHTYDKIHLVPMLDEPTYLAGGKESAKIFELDGVKMGIIICYDLRFPELTRQLALEGAEVLFIVAEWPLARRNHWVALQKARAIENQMYVISSGRVGSYNGTTFSGTSFIIDPLGDVVAEGSIENEETIVGELDSSKVRDARKNVPVFQTRVTNLYKYY